MAVTLKRAAAAKSTDDDKNMKNAPPVDENEDGTETDPKSKKGKETDNDQSNDGDKDKDAKNGVVLTGAAGERQRVKAITTGTHAASFPSLAAHLAFETDLSADVANGILAAAMGDVATEASADTGGKAQGDSPRGAAFKQAMNGSAPNPPLGAGGGNGRQEPVDPWLAAAKTLKVA